MSIPTIQLTDYKTQMINKFSIPLIGSEDQQSFFNIKEIENLADLLGAVNPQVLLSAKYPYLVADTFETVQREIDIAYRTDNFDSSEWDGVISYCLHVKSDIFPSGIIANIGKEYSFIEYSKLIPESEPSGETLHLIDWIETEYSIDRWLDKTADELKSMFHELLYSGLNSRSIADTLNDIIITTLTYRVDYQYVIDYLNGRKQEATFLEWVKTDFTPAGSNYFLSNNPNDFNQYDLGLLINTYNLVNGSKVKLNDHIEHSLSTLSIA